MLRDGEISGSAPIGEMSDEQMLRLIVGRTVTNVFPARARHKAEASSLTVERTFRGGFHDVNLDARAGEIVGIAGISGNGQSEFLRSLAGLLNATGQVLLAGKPIKRHPEAASHAGITFLSSDRHKEGLFMSLSVRENAALSALPRFAQFGVVRRRVEVQRVEEQRARWRSGPHQLMRQCRQFYPAATSKKSFSPARCLRTRQLVLAEEPTAGVDVGARSEIYRILRDVADRGTPVVIVSSDMLELEGLCDRVMVFSRGHVVGELTGADVTEEKIGRTMITATAHRRAQGRARPAGPRRQSNLHPTDAPVRRRRLCAEPSVGVVDFGPWRLCDQRQRAFRFRLQYRKTFVVDGGVVVYRLRSDVLHFYGGIDVSVGPLVGLA